MVGENPPPQNVTIVPPTLEPLDTRSQNMVKEWSFWQRSFERYCRITNQNDEQKKIDIFFAFVGRDTEDYLRDLPDFDTLNTVQKLLDKVESRYNKVPNVLYERFHFKNVKICNGETISDFNARLNSLSKYCNFNQYSRDLAHLDQIILNAAPKLREKLLLEKDLTLTKAIEIATYAAHGSDWANQFREASNSSSGEVNFNMTKSFKSKFSKESSNSNYVKTNQSKDQKCFRCGSSRHLANFDDCPAKKVSCNKCNRTGHFAKYCRSKGDVKTVSVEPVEDSFCFNVLSVNSNIGKHKFLDLNINGNWINFIVDSGSQATLLPKNLFDKLDAKLSPVSASLVDYNGNKIACAGESLINVELNDDQFVKKR